MLNITPEFKSITQNHLQEVIPGMVPAEVTHFIFHFSYSGGRMCDIDVNIEVDEDEVDLEEEYIDTCGSISDNIESWLHEDVEEIEFTYDNGVVTMTYC